ncbi:hypothetical protein [Kordiimonas aquimaris]|uniref:hypothetical protein n=1 Tax=Kordiimonas aquimaris TaxID=707591 RepID=UPI0021D0F9A7|nr:hypothetical protein [Kordiimonas aquimaris]
MSTATTYKPAAKWPALPVVILLLTFTLPPETSLSVGSLRLSPYRVTLIALIVPAINMLLQDRHNPAGWPDGLMAMHGLWAGLSLIVTMGLSEGIETAGIYFVETFGAYVVARAYIKTTDDYAAVLKLIFTVAAGLLIFAAAESFSGTHILREPFKAIFGGSGPHYIEPRLGLTRAFASFEHPILFGVFSASAFAGTYYILGNAQLNLASVKKLAAIGMATFFSLSGGPFTALALQMGIIAWDRFTAGVANRWTILLAIMAAAWLVLTMASNRSPILVFISYLTFSANSAYNRVHIWNYGTAEVARHPIFGIGLNDWIRAPWMSSSMDNFWLLTTVRYGLPALLFLLLSLVIIGMRQTRQKSTSDANKNARKSWLVTLLSFTLAGLTVHFWNSLMVQFFFLIGCGVALTQEHRPSQAKQQFTPQKSPQIQERLLWI